MTTLDSLIYAKSLCLFLFSHDYFDPLIYPKSLSANGGHRMATLLIYLQSALAGGQTSFPRARLNITAQAGDAILFFDLLDNGEPDERSLHEGVAPTRGIKYAINGWVRSKHLFG